MMRCAVAPRCLPRRQARTFTTAAAALALAVSGCGGGPDEPASTTRNHRAEGTSELAPDSTGSNGAGTAGPSVNGDPSAKAADSATTGSADAVVEDEDVVVEELTPVSQDNFVLPPFASPTGNIVCRMMLFEGEASAFCWVLEAEWGFPEPSNCDLDWMSTALFVGEESGGGDCRGDAPFTEEPTTLQYGKGLRVGDIVCESRRSGVKCSNLVTDHGFRAARAEYALF